MADTLVQACTNRPYCAAWRRLESQRENCLEVVTAGSARCYIHIFTPSTSMLPLPHLVTTHFESRPTFPVSSGLFRSIQGCGGGAAAAAAAGATPLSLAMDELFEEWDTDGNKQITKNELRRGLIKLGVYLSAVRVACSCPVPRASVLRRREGARLPVFSIFFLLRHSFCFGGMRCSQLCCCFGSVRLLGFPFFFFFFAVSRGDTCLLSVCGGVPSSGEHVHVNLLSIRVSMHIRMKFQLWVPASTPNRNSIPSTGSFAQHMQTKT